MDNFLSNIIVKGQQSIDIKRNQIYEMDCMEVLQSLPAGSVDLIIADPPYYHMKGTFDFVFDSIPQYLEWCSAWVAECYRILKPAGAFYWVVSSNL